MVTHLTSKEVDTYRGVVLGIRKNGPDSRFTIADVRVCLVVRVEICRP